MKLTALVTALTMMVAFAGADTSPRQLRSILTTPIQGTDNYDGNRQLRSEGLHVINGILEGLTSLLKNLKPANPSTASTDSATTEQSPDEIDILRSRRVS
ncbi:hypothetical protein V7S43_009192 [Phytophthora oleae]|uniref:RxLR effector protein n=1 Tax=Phytophthora oleae TaxID=2107226 RepID=A0ABD3FFN7_9STRA